jgi:hypothetical protein
MALPPRPVILAVTALRRRLKYLADAIVPPSLALLDMTTGIVPAQIAATMAELGIAEVIGDRAMTASEVAERVGTDPDATQRLLRGASSYGLCKMHPDTGVVTLTRKGKALRSDDRESLREWAIYLGSRTALEACSGLAGSIQTNESSFAAIHGMSVWEWFANHPDEERTFADAMRRATTLNGPLIANAYPWPKEGVICDVAGGVGTLLAAIIGESRDPGLRGVVVDGPGVIAEAPAYLKSRGLADRINAVVGDMFGVISAAADVYLLKDILHDWDDDRCRRILRSVSAAMPSGSKLVLIEIIEDRNRPTPFAPFIDLLMLIVCDGGRQRSVDELEALLAEAGLRPTGEIRTAGPYHLVEAAKP